MRDGAIPMAADDVRAILEGRKTQFRIPLDPLFAPVCLRWVPEIEAGVSYPEQGWWTCEVAPRTYTGRVEVGTWPSARLWVKEEWRPGAWHGDRGVAVDYRASPELNRTPWCAVPAEEWDTLLAAMTQEAKQAWLGGLGSVRQNADATAWTWNRGDSPCLWRPAIQMPQWASRLTLTVSEVRVQWLREISEEDALAEGAPPADEAADWDFWEEAKGSHRAGFASLWNSNHGSAAWDRNPLVAAITFTAERQNIDAALGRTAAHG